MNRPRFNTIYTGDWPYHRSDGVGLEFTGAVTDEAGLIDMMWHGYSCHPIVGKEIVDELKSSGVRRTTVMAHLNFDRLYIDLKAYGVNMKIITPCSVKEPNRVLPQVQHDPKRMVR